VRATRSAGLSAGGVVAIIFGLIALILLVALIVVLLQRRSGHKRLGGDYGADKEWHPLRDPVAPPATTYSWQAPVTPGGADVQSIHEAGSIQNSVGYSNSPMIGPATMVAIPDGLRAGVRTDSRQLDLEIPGFEMQSRASSVAYPDRAIGYGGPVHELDSTAAVEETASSPQPGPSATGTDDGDKIFVSQSSPSENTSQIQDIESAKTRLQERRQRLLELHQVDEEEARLNQQLAALRGGGTPNSLVNEAR
jgi:hypothetical protein